MIEDIGTDMPESLHLASYFRMVGVPVCASPSARPITQRDVGSKVLGGERRQREEYAYNRQQERIEKTDQNGTVHGYDFDGLGRPTQDRITTVGTGVDSAVRRVETSYDVRGQVDSITSLDNAIVGSGTVLNQIVTRFNDFGQQPNVMMDLWDGTSGIYAGFDRFGRIIDLPWIQDPSGTPSDLARIKYGYNRASSPTYARDEVARAHGADLDQLYSYDGLPRLIDFQQGQLNVGNTAITSSTLTQDWDLDQVGNWDGFNQGVSGVLDQTRTHNRVNEITDISNGSGQPVWIDPAYDDAGNMTLTPRPNAPTDGFTLTYDAWNRITKVETSDSAPKLVAKYGYDGRNHRISKEVDDASGSLEATIKFFYNAAWQCLEERETLVGGSNATKTYVWGQHYIDDLVCRDDSSTRLYAMQDRQFKTIAITSTSGSVVERYSYTPYGKTFFYDSTFTQRTTSAFDWVYLYTTRRLDTETALYYFRNRYYDSSLGRFCSRDPSGFEGSPWNIYEFLNGHPLFGTDSTGLAVDSVSQAARACMSQATFPLILACLQPLLPGSPVARRIFANINRLNHIFTNPRHVLGGAIRCLGSPAAVYRAIMNALRAKLAAGTLVIQANGTFVTSVNVGGQILNVRGAVVNGVIRLGTVFQ